MDTIDYRVLSNTDDLEQIVDLEMDVWGTGPRDAVPMSIMRAISIHGGLISGAYIGDKLVGMGLAFPARSHGKWLLWSHMAGVHPDYQDRGIGFGVKQAQRDWALDHGFKEIAWTYDPLLRGNANFNLHRLGATAFTYHIDYYGIMRDAINPPIPSDRLEASWNLNDRRVKTIAGGATPAPAIKTFKDDAFVLRSDSSGRPLMADLSALPEPFAFAQIPRSTAGFDLGMIEPWRMALRQTLTTAFAAGYVAVDFVDTGDRCLYVLRAPTRWSLYIVRCADDSLYTGISPDVEKRVRLHNAGRGAAYTSTRRPVQLLASWVYPTKSEALKAELAFKKLTRAQKFGRIAKSDPL